LDISLKKLGPMTAVVLTVFVSGAAHAEVRGLHIGIDQYERLSTLEGATEDARDIASSIENVGATDVTLLLNEEADRNSIFGNWQSILNRSVEGDTIVFSYAGHGAQQPERIRGSEEDGLDELFLLGGFSQFGNGTRERIIDDEISQWFADAESRGVTVIFIADSCHSGDMTRSWDPRVPQPGTRYAGYYQFEEDELVVQIPEDAAFSEEAELGNVVFLSASQENQVVPEILIIENWGEPAQLRGALSYAVARALEGAADADGDEVLNQGELFSFVRTQVRSLAASRQTPNLRTAMPEASVLFPVPRSSSQTNDFDQPPLVRLALLNSNAMRTLEGVEIVDDNSTYDLIYDGPAAELITNSGDIVAFGLSVDRLQGAIDGWRAINAMTHLCSGARLETRIYPNDTRHAAGSELAFGVSPVRNRWLILFSIAGDGTVYLHYPNSPEEHAVQQVDGFEIRFLATAPFGADYLITLASDQNLGIIENEFGELHGTQDALRAAALACAASAEPSVSLGMQGVYTTR